MRKIIKKANSKWILLFLFTFFSVGVQGQWNEYTNIEDYLRDNPCAIVTSEHESVYGDEGLALYMSGHSDFENSLITNPYDGIYHVPVGTMTIDFSDCGNSSNPPHGLDDSGNWDPYGGGGTYYYGSTAGDSGGGSGGTTSSEPPPPCIIESCPVGFNLVGCDCIAFKPPPCPNRIVCTGVIINCECVQKADPCADIKNILNYNATVPDNLKSNINRLKGVVEARINKQEHAFEVTKNMNPDETFRYGFNQVPPGSKYAVESNVGGSIIGKFHTHPSDGVPIFSYLDLRSLLNTYDYASPSKKQDVFSGLVVKDAQGNTNVYMLKIDDVEALRKQVNAMWDQKDYSKITDEEKKIKAIHYDQAEIFYKSNGQIEKSFLEQFPSAGISLYKADASISKFDKLTLNNGTVTPNPCN